MEDLKKQYAETIEKRKVILEQISALENDEKIKEFFRLRKENNELYALETKLYKEIKFKEYASCNHIWVIDSHDYDPCEGRSYNYHGCIKCGLDYRVFCLEEYHNRFYQSLDEKIMYEFLEKYGSFTGINTRIKCDLDLGKSIYLKIKEAHPNIDDETALKYFEIALHNIRNNRVSEERKISRARRLSLNPKFNKWRGYDVEI